MKALKGAHPEESPCRGLLCDCEIFGNLRITFVSSSSAEAASPRDALPCTGHQSHLLVLVPRPYCQLEPAAPGADTLLVPSEHAARLQLVVPSWKCRICFYPIVRSRNDEILMHGKLKSILLKCHDKVLGLTFCFHIKI